MIPTKMRESRRVKGLKMPKNLERLYKAGKCRDCAVVVTRMDFGRILGKFTKVKIKFENSSTPKPRHNPVVSPNSNARLKNNENGMVLLHRNSYSQHPVKEVIAKKSKQIESITRDTPNILKENNRLKKTVKEKSYDKKQTLTTSSLYGIVFEDPLDNNIEVCSKIGLTDLLPNINESILPSINWCIDYFPKSDEPKDDKVYDRIAAELEDLMYNEKSKEIKPETEGKVDDFPSIMDILNDNTSEVKPSVENNTDEFKPSLESSDVEAMLLGKSNSNDTTATLQTEADRSMETEENTDMRSLLEDVNQLNVENKMPTAMEIDENPQSPSILDEALQKGIEEHLPSETNIDSVKQVNTSIEKQPETSTDTEKINNEGKESESKNNNGKIDLASKTGITHVLFKKVLGTNSKVVTCPKNLKYSIELDGKSVEFLGAPKFITNMEELKVLLQIVDETELDSLYVLH